MKRHMVLAPLFVALGAATANAAVTLGPALPVATPTTNLCGAGVACTYINTLGGAAFPIQATSGVITSWRVQSGSAGGAVKLRVLRQTVPGQYRAIATSGQETTVVGLGTYASRVPIQAGDVIGVDNDNSALIFTQTAAASYFFNPAIADGAAETPKTSAAAAVLLLLANATIEADVDQDGFGDETQDGCPSDRTKQAAPCATEFELGPVALTPARIRLPIRSSQVVRARFAVTRPSNVTLTVEVRRSGRSFGGVCVPAEFVSTGARCTVVFTVRQLTRAVPAGVSTIAFRPRGLPRGVYRVRVKASDTISTRTGESASLLRIVTR